MPGSAEANCAWGSILTKASWRVTTLGPPSAFLLFKQITEMASPSSSYMDLCVNGPGLVRKEWCYTAQ